MPGVCPRCSKNVYFAEEYRCSGKSWHKLCLTCMNCSKLVEPGAMLEHEAQIYCKTCYRSLFGPKGYGFGGILAKDVTISPDTVRKDVLTTPEDKVDAPRSGGGWVSPRLIRSTQKLLAEANLDPEESPRQAKNYWSGGLTTETLRTSPRKVSAGFGGGAASGGSARKLHLPKYEDMPKNSSDVVQPKIMFSESKSDEKIKKDPPNSPYRSATLPRLSSTSKPAMILSETDLTKTQPQHSLRSAFNLPNSKSDILSSPLPKPRMLTTSSTSSLSTSEIPRLGYKPKASPWKASVAPSCSRCSKPVYQAELARACGSVWHKTCFTCSECAKLLDSSTLCDRGGDIFCRSCYQKNFGPKGVGFGIANLQTQ